MTLPSQINAYATSDGQQDTFVESAAPDFTRKDAGGAELKEPRNSLGQNSGEGNEYLLKLVASLEACNMALLNKLNQAERELATLRKSIAQTLPGTKSTDGLEQSFG